MRLFLLRKLYLPGLSEHQATPIADRDKSHCGQPHTLGARQAVSESEGHVAQRFDVVGAQGETLERNQLGSLIATLRDTIHLAARMEQLARPGSILLTPSTLALAEGFIEVKPFGKAPVKGLADPLEVYEVTGVGPARTRLQAVARRGLTRFVGRDAELEQLRRAQARARGGRGQVAALVAEPAYRPKSRATYDRFHALAWGSALYSWTNASLARQPRASPSPLARP